MELCDIDAEIIYKLFERRNAFSDRLRSGVASVAEGKIGAVDLDDLAYWFGIGQGDVNAWFFEMGRFYGWPEADSTSRLTFDVDSGGVYLEKRAGVIQEKEEDETVESEKEDAVVL